MVDGATMQKIMVDGARMQIIMVDGATLQIIMVDAATMQINMVDGATMQTEEYQVLLLDSTVGNQCLDIPCAVPSPSDQMYSHYHPQDNYYHHHQNHDEDVDDPLKTDL